MRSGVFLSTFVLAAAIVGTGNAEQYVFRTTAGLTVPAVVPPDEQEPDPVPPPEITFVGALQSNYGWTVPAGHQPGDLLLVAQSIVSCGAGSFPSVSAGWTVVHETLNNFACRRVVAKWATSDAETHPSLPNSNTQYVQSAFVYRDVADPENLPPVSSVLSVNTLDSGWTSSMPYPTNNAFPDGGWTVLAMHVYSQVTMPVISGFTSRGTLASSGSSVASDSNSVTSGFATAIGSKVNTNNNWGASYTIRVKAP
jgi:hypothetical protein